MTVSTLLLGSQQRGKPMFTITVTYPSSGRQLTWSSDNRKSVINQAKIEVGTGAEVEVKNSLGRIIWNG